MEIYILKSAACLAVFFAFYKLVLENTSIHHFKRFYLLGGLVASFLIPLITFTTYVETSPSTLILNEWNSQEILSEGPASINYWPAILWTIYGLGVLFFSVKFFRNLFGLIQKIQKNPKFRNRSFINILLTETVIPHTFFSYIFLNKEQFEHDEIPSEVMLHEEAHARQKHSLDIVLIEVFQLLFWFNPIFYFLKRSVKLNHEFLADRAVLNAGSETSHYQKILLAFSTPNSYQETESPSLAHSLNYSSTKKRFKAMKTRTSSRTILLRSLLLLPLLSLLIYGFSTKEVENIKHSDQILEGKPFLKVHVIGKTITVNDSETTISNFASAVNAVTNDWSKKDFKLYELNIKEENVSDSYRDRINAEFRKTNLAKQSEGENIYILGSFGGLPQPPMPPSIYDNVPGPNQPVKHIKAMEKMDAIFLYNDKSITAEKAIELLKTNKNLAVQTTLNDPKPPVVTISKRSDDSLIQHKANKAEIAEYNKLAKAYNAANNKNQVIKKKDLERLHSLYGKMSIEQKGSSEPFPNIPPPPPPAPKPIKVKSGDNNNVPPLPPPPPTPKISYNKKVKSNKSMDKAIYYYNDMVITPQRATELLNNNKKLKVYITKTEDGNGTVTLSETPIYNNNDKSLKTPSAENKNLYMAAEAPPAPNADPVKYIKELGKRGAVFYIGPHKYSLEEAIKMVEKSENGVTIDTSNYPDVHLGGC